MPIHGFHLMRMRDTVYSVVLPSRKMDTRNGVTRCGSPASPEQVANRKPPLGGIPQEANALGNAGDRLTWGRYARRHGDRMGSSLMADATDEGPPRTEDRTQVYILKVHVPSSEDE